MGVTSMLKLIRRIKQLFIMMLLLSFSFTSTTVHSATIQTSTDSTADSSKDSNDDSNLFRGNFSFSPWSDGTYLYYTAWYDIYKINLKTKKKTKVYSFKESNGLSDLSVYGDFIYCTYDISYGSECYTYAIYQISKDGKELKKLSFGHSPSVSDDWIYYIKTKNVIDEYFQYSKSIGIYKMKLDGSEDICIKKGDFYNCLTNGDKIYYSTSEGFYQMDMNGKNSKFLMNETFPQKGIGNDNFYWYDSESSSILVKNANKPKYSKLLKDVDYAFTIDEDYMYYAKDNTLYKSDLTGKKSTKISKYFGDIYNMRVYGNYIFYKTIVEDYECYYLIDLSTKYHKRVFERWNLYN